MDKYEKEVLSGLKTLTLFFGVLVLCNLTLPTFVPVKLGYSSIFTYIVIVIHAKGVMNAWGYGEQYVPLAQIILTRFAEVCYYFFISKYDISFVVFIILLGLDFLLLILEHIDRNKYEYIRESEE